MDLATILREHATWVDSGGASGARANLSSAQLQNEQLPLALLERVHAPNSIWTDADLRRSKFTQATLTNANFTGIDAGWSIFAGAGLLMSKFVGAALSNADFTGANLQYASLKDATLVDASFRGANLSDVSLKGANCNGVDFKDAILARTGIDNVTFSGARNIIPTDITALGRRMAAVWHTDHWMISAGPYWFTVEQAVAYWSVEREEVSPPVRDFYLSFAAGLPPYWSA